MRTGRTALDRFSPIRDLGCLVVPIAFQHHEGQAFLALIPLKRTLESRFSNEGKDEKQHEQDPACADARHCNEYDHATERSTASAKVRATETSDYSERFRSPCLGPDDCRRNLDSVETL
jgi:hypothetical protein